MITISLCMIVKDEEKTLARCLKCASKFADEIIIVDTGSKDKTKEIAKSFNCKLYDLKWEDNFEKARNYSFSKATKDYIMWLDADDFIDEDNIRLLNDLKENLDSSVDSVMMNYSLVRDAEGKTTYSLKRNRLVKREKGYRWVGRVHEFLSIYGNIIQSDITINHDKKKAHTNRNLLIFKKMEENKEDFTTRDLFYYSNELYDNGLYKEAIEKYKEVLSKEDLWSEDFKRATINLVKLLDLTGGDNDEKIDFIFDCMKKYSPNAEMLCLLASCFKLKGMYDEGIIYLKSAMTLDEDRNNIGFNNNIYSTWYPALELCVCYSLIGDVEKAYYYNELSSLYLAPKYKVDFNRKYLLEEMKKKNLEPRRLKKTLNFDI